MNGRDPTGVPAGLRESLGPPQPCLTSAEDYEGLTFGLSARGLLTLKKIYTMPKERRRLPPALNAGGLRSPWAHAPAFWLPNRARHSCDSKLNCEGHRFGLEGVQLDCELAFLDCRAIGKRPARFPEFSRLVNRRKNSLACRARDVGGTSAGGLQLAVAAQNLRQ